MGMNTPAMKNKNCPFVIIIKGRRKNKNTFQCILLCSWDDMRFDSHMY